MLAGWALEDQVSDLCRFFVAACAHRAMFDCEMKTLVGNASEYKLVLKKIEVFALVDLLIAEVLHHLGRVLKNPVKNTNILVHLKKQQQDICPYFRPFPSNGAFEKQTKKDNMSLIWAVSFQWPLRKNNIINGKFVLVSTCSSWIFSSKKLRPE